MKRLGMVLFSVLVLALLPAAIRAQCAKDTECKGDRICQQGICADPSHTNAPQPPILQPVPAQQEVIIETRTGPNATSAVYDVGYLSTAFVMGMGSWGKLTKKYDDGEDFAEVLQEGGTPGIRLAGYYVPDAASHLGLYFRAARSTGVTFTDDEDKLTYYDNNVKVSHFGVGLSLKLGTQKGKRLWLGLTLDLGYAVEKFKRDIDTHFDEDDNEIESGSENGSKRIDKFSGVELSPNLGMDIFLFNLGNFPVSISLSMGALVIPFLERQRGEKTGYQQRHWFVSPVINAGISVGG